MIPFLTLSRLTSAGLIALAIADVCGFHLSPGFLIGIAALLNLLICRLAITIERNAPGIVDGDPMAALPRVRA